MDNQTLNTLKGLLGEDADKKIAAVMSSLTGNNNSSSKGSDSSVTSGLENSTQNSSASLPAFNTDSLDSIVQIKKMIEGLANNTNDSRSNLLISLKPYMRKTRQSSIDSAIRLLNIGKLSGLFRKG